MADESMKPQDSVNVHPRIAWGAIMAGTFVALVTLLVLSTLGLAVGLSVSHGALPTGPVNLVWNLLVASATFFLGGWATSQCVARETRWEAAFYGAVLWGVTYLGLIFLGLYGIFTGFNVILGIGTIAGYQSFSSIEAAQLATILDLSPDQMATLEALVRDSAAGTNVESSAWWTCVGVMTSVLAAMLGSIVGSGSTFSLRGTLIGHKPTIEAATS